MSFHGSVVASFGDDPESILARLDYLLAETSPDQAFQLATARAAYDLWLRGFSVVPPDELGSKQPIGKNVPWKMFQVQRATPAQMYQWYIVEKRSGVGVVTGAVSWHLHCLEWEARAVSEGFFAECVEGFVRDGLADTWNALSAYMERTPSGGVHVYYRLRSDRSRKVIVAGRGSDGNSKVYVEDLGGGGYVIAGPSFGTIHPSGGSYIPTTTPWLSEAIDGMADYVEALQNGNAPLFRANVFEVGAIDALHASIRCTAEAAGIVTPVEAPQPAVVPFEHYRRSRQWVGKRSVAYWFDRLKADPNVQDIVFGLVSEAGWTELERRNGIIYLNRPDTDSHLNVHGTIGHRGPGVFYSFSTTDKLFGEKGPLGAQRTFSPGQVLAVVRHKGNYRAAADDIARYYGEAR